MIQTAGEIITEVLVRNNRNTTDSFITDAILQDWIRMAHKYVSTQYKWPFSEVRDKTLAWDGSEEIAYSSFTIDYKADSIRILLIGDKRLEKMNFEDYQLMREERPSAQDRVFSDYGRILFINPSADVSGTIAAFGQYTPSIDPTDTSATTIFSTYDEEGNEAIVEKMTAYLKEREHQLDEVAVHNEKCDLILEKVWKKIQNEQYKYKTGRDSDGLFRRFDVLEGGYRDELFNRDQFT